MIYQKDIIVTLPKTIKWSDYEKELKDVEEQGLDLNFKVARLPKDIILNKTRCWITHNGFIQGYMIIASTKDNDAFNCATTGVYWLGKFIVRSGKFYPISKLPYKGFQGFRYFYYQKYILENTHNLSIIK